MAKKHRNQQIAVAFNYLTKSLPDDDGENAREEGFTVGEFRRVLARLRDTAPLDDHDDEVIRQIKLGLNMNFLYYEEIEPGLYFGDFEGAYYGQKIRNNILGDIDPDSLNMRKFHYIITRLNDGKILVGTTYHGLYGDWGGLRSCLTHHLDGDYVVASKTLRSISTEIGAGHPVSIKLTYRKGANRAEHQPLFGSTGEIAIKKSDFEGNFEQRVIDEVRRVRGTDRDRKRILAEIVSQGQIVELDEDDIIGCSALVREEGKYRTVYFLGESPQSTRFPLQVAVGVHGDADRGHVAEEMVRMMRESILPLLHNARPA